MLFDKHDKFFAPARYLPNNQSPVLVNSRCEISSDSAVVWQASDRLHACTSLFICERVVLLLQPVTLYSVTLYPVTLYSVTPRPVTLHPVTLHLVILARRSLWLSNRDEVPMFASDLMRIFVVKRKTSHPWLYDSL